MCFLLFVHEIFIQTVPGIDAMKGGMGQAGFSIGNTLMRSHPVSLYLLKPAERPSAGEGPKLPEPLD
jgi:hypothetical protein